MPIVASQVSTRAGPIGDGKLGGAEAEGVAALGVEMHLDGDAGVLEGDVVEERVVDAVDMVVFVLEEEGGWGVG